MLRETFNWDKLSVIAGRTLWNFYFRLYEGSVKGERAAAFLQALLRHVRGKLLVIWDGRGHPPQQAGQGLAGPKPGPTLVGKTSRLCP